MEATAKHDFRATQEDELSFSKGATLKVIYFHAVPILGRAVYNFVRC